FRSVPPQFGAVVYTSRCHLVELRERENDVRTQDLRRRGGRAHRVDVVFTGPAEYVVIHERTGAEPIVAFERDNYLPASTPPPTTGSPRWSRCEAPRSP